MRNKAKGGAKTNRVNTVTVRVTPELLKAGQRVALATCRTMSSLMEYALRRYIEKNFPEAFHKDAKLIIKWDDAPED